MKTVLCDLDPKMVAHIKRAHTVDVVVRKDGNETRYDGSFLKAALTDSPEWILGECYVCDYHGSVRQFGTSAGTGSPVYLDAVCITKIEKIVPPEQMS